MSNKTTYLLIYMLLDKVTVNSVFSVTQIWTCTSLKKCLSAVTF